MRHFSSVLILITFLVGVQCQDEIVPDNSTIPIQACVDEFCRVCGMNKQGSYMLFDNDCRMQQFNNGVKDLASVYSSVDVRDCIKSDQEICKYIRCAYPEYPNALSTSKPYMCITNGCIMIPIYSHCQFTVLNCGARARCGGFAFYKYGACPRFWY